MRQLYTNFKTKFSLLFLVKFRTHIIIQHNMKQRNEENVRLNDMISTLYIWELQRYRKKNNNVEIATITLRLREACNMNNKCMITFTLDGWWNSNKEKLCDRRKSFEFSSVEYVMMSSQYILFLQKKFT